MGYNARNDAPIRVAVSALAGSEGKNPRRVLPVMQAPVRRSPAARHLALETVGNTPALPGDEVCDFSFGLSPTRLMHSVKNSAKDAPQNADLLLDRARWRLATNVRS
jgi:hypothetical protein